MSHYETTQLQVNKQNLQDVRIETGSLDTQSLKPGQVLLEVETFGFSANNITYALLGEKMGYWGFFSAEQAYGVVPVWGFAHVADSTVDGIEVGEKVYGYLPFGSHLIIEPGKISDYSFSDLAPCRKSISPVYDSYIRCQQDPSYREDEEVVQVNFKPLFMTSFVLNETVLEQCGVEEQQIIITSASSKTAMGAAFLLKHAKQQQGKSLTIIGLTSSGNKALVEESGCYDQVFSYDESENLNFQQASWILDFAGNKSLLLSLQQNLKQYLTKMLFIGVTDVQAQAISSQGTLNGEMFFAPAEVSRLTKQWGQGEFASRYAKAWQGFIDQVNTLMRIEIVDNAAALKALYLDGLAGKLDTQKMIKASFS